MRAAVAAVGVALLLTSCAALASPAAPTVPELGAATVDVPPARVPDGGLTVAYPTPVGSWLGDDPEDVAAVDLAALWSLPLYRTDPEGRTVPALAADARVVVEDPTAWVVEVDLRPGTWSDGLPVTADDVVATAEALAARRPAEWRAWTDATAVDDDTVRLGFDRPFATWHALLSRPPGVLPAHVLRADGLAAYDEDVPVSGGWFALAAHEPGLRASFDAHAGSPSGAPSLARLEVLVVPGFTDALGLLAGGTVDAAVGHVALDPSARWSEIPDVRGAVAFGGTRFELTWPDGRGTPEQRAAAAGIDVAPFVDGLLRDVGRRPGGLVPDGPPVTWPADVDAVGDARVQVPRGVEGLSLVARRLQADLVDAGGSATLVRLDPPDQLTDPLGSDARLRLVRIDRWRSAAAVLDDLGLDPTPGTLVDATGGAATVDLDTLLVGDPRLVPVAEVAVAHVWDPARVAGMQPSGWPGLAFWAAADLAAPTD